MHLRSFPVVILALIAFAQPVLAGPQWYACTSWGGSHTGRYTFRIDASACEVFWKELDQSLSIDACEPPYIAARKPFALNDEYVLRFNVETGRFSDSVSGWTEFGTCRKVNTFPQKLPS
ncbi:MAG: hypothetical protein U1E46_17900 [Hyphomicrobiales bacterium]